MKRIQAKAGGLIIGGGAPIAVQTMCNTHTQDVEKSVTQCLQMAEAGAKLIRLTTQGFKEVEALAKIKDILRNQGIKTPLVADVHFNSEVAIAAAQVADKVRINPGNFSQVHKDAQSQFARFIEECRKYGTAVRIGLNHGSLGEDIVNRWGNTPEGMKQAAMQWLAMCIDEKFDNVVVSLKASNTIVMSQAYLLLFKAMEESGTVFPVHLGVTEAGNADQGRIKSAIGIGALLDKGIGDTIRVSLTENPVNEIPAGQEIASFFESGLEGKLKALVRQQNSRTPELPFKAFECGKEDWNRFIIRTSSLFGVMLLEKEIDDFTIAEAPYSEKIMEALKENIQQGARRVFYHPEYIACPGCGRTQYNLEETFNKVKEKTSHLKGVRIAVMGCIVNGPGEMADADYGYVGQGGGLVTIYKGKNPVLRSVPDSEAIDKLLKIIEEDQSNS
ncbi:MAG: (E)-4-hydroxy-3-methylbut-2-enyl-diphosphate synthase [Bacteroidales bacterium]|nr:(E)-4-hydroxy-3-methylbut-2-enyl-diphosphate synthase [Bacteroidales bacterium]